MLVLLSEREGEPLAMQPGGVPEPVVAGQQLLAAQSAQRRLKLRVNHRDVGDPQACPPEESYRVSLAVRRGLGWPCAARRGGLGCAHRIS